MTLERRRKRKEVQEAEEKEGIRFYINLIYMLLWFKFLVIQ
jgi:hypothetical protein